MGVKLLYVYGDGDYNVVDFENSELGKKPYKEVYDLILNEYGGSYTEEDDEGNEAFTVCAYEFEDTVVTQDFIDFLNDKKDYDVTKCEDWFIVDMGK